MSQNPYETPEAMADFLLTGRKKVEHIIGYLRGCEEVHRNANDVTMADFWRRTREVVEARQKT